MIYPSRRKLVCGVAHRMRSRTQKVREYVHFCLMDFRRDEFDGSQNFETSFPKRLEVLILEKVALRGYSRPTADEGIQDVLVVGSNLSHKTSMQVSLVTSVLRFVGVLANFLPKVI